MIETARLRLRPWREADREPSWAMAQDPDVMRYLLPLTREESDAAIDRMMAMQAEHGHCFWAVERKDNGRLIGFCGIIAPREPIFEYEIGWRFERDAWGQAYAREAAQASLDWAWANLATQTVVAITNPANERSWGLMLRLGMTSNPAEDFDHPDLTEGDPLRRCLLYRIARPR